MAALTVQPAAQLARAQESAPATFEVVGVAGATLRAEANGASAALGIVSAGSTVTLAGPDVVTSGTVWRQVRTTDGVVGYLPVSFLMQTSGPPVQTAAAVNAPAATSTPVASAGAAGDGAVQTAASNPANPASDGAENSRSAAVRGPDLTPTPAPSPTPTGPRTTVEHRRGQDVTITHIDVERAPGGSEMGAGRIIVKFKSGAAQATRADAHQVAGASTTESLRLPDTVVAKVRPGTVDQALAAYRARPDVEYAEPDYIRRTSVTPNDANFSQQWNMQKIGAPVAWDLTTGTNAPKIAILDCGVYTESSTFRAPDNQFGHPDIRGKVVAEQNFTTATTGADDFCDHGTLMAGVAGAATNNSLGVAGVAFNAKLMNGKVLDDNGDGFDSWVASGIVWAADNGAGVISMSLGGDGPCNQTLQSAIDYAWNKGAVIVAAAGNGGPDEIGDPLPEAPGSCNHVIPVGAIDQLDAKASFSNYNANPAAGAVVPIAAPGVNVLSTDFLGTYSTVSGTSPATPHVAGAAALIKLLYPGEANSQIVARLINNAAPIAGTGTYWANGRLDIPAAMSGATCSPRPKVNVTTSANGAYLNVTLTATGVGNVIRYFQVNGNVGQMTNANVVFRATYGGNPVISPVTWGGASTYVGSNTTASVSFEVHRNSAGSAATVHVRGQDVCGSWSTFVGGGTGNGVGF
ncbi:MAG: S8 family serine peptidase [Chloroflexota bacterium]